MKGPLAREYRKLSAIKKEKRESLMFLKVRQTLKQALSKNEDIQTAHTFMKRCLAKGKVKLQYRTTKDTHQRGWLKCRTLPSVGENVRQ